ncbi:hypothetical protein AKJ65_00045 [candidate division MSBL1 archaeon SCGC-AAA259E19]|uniref:7,8-didemethyl-8-hydroxy-5-deazariboflavin synthase n=1 Tax=candidate division MSBL1 archaeon SCGC-AAA259E19 TaxID=1698264 RepID=A0A133UP31_9EURY|nr:hypothetical protein AKJ65_00045 [candidate division MSBL1 archaeon SCGC-AAA259E19]
MSFSRSVFLPVTNLCRNNCSYCGFRRDPEEGAWFLSKKEVLELAKRGRERGCSEALFTLGERPEVYDSVKKRLDEWGYSGTVDYLEDLCKSVLDIDLLPHVNPGILEKRELEKLRSWSASMGLMLESTAELPAHDDSPGKDPNLRLKTIAEAGKLKIPFTTGLLVGVGESREDRKESLLEIRDLNRKYGHIQEIIIQPFAPKAGTLMGNAPPPSYSKILSTVEEARRLMPEMNIQVPPNLIDNGKIIGLIRAGVNDLGGISNVTPDFINPENPWPSIPELKDMLESKDFKLGERLPIYPEFVLDDKFMSSKTQEKIRKMADESGYRRA